MIVCSDREFQWSVISDNEDDEGNDYTCIYIVMLKSLKKFTCKSKYN